MPTADNLADAVFPRRLRLQAQGIILGTVQRAASKIGGRIVCNRSLQMLGWRGSLDHGVDERLWRTLVANRTQDGKTAPAWYRRACALALTNLNDNGDLLLEHMVLDKSQPSTMSDYLTRVQAVTKGRRVFSCATDDSGNTSTPAGEAWDEVICGLGSRYVWTGDKICILFGYSVPVVLCPMMHTRHDVTLVGACYVHGHMEGEQFAGLSEEEIANRSRYFGIH